jgi:hypothetical protein
MTIISPYSPYLAPFYVILFQKKTLKLKGRHFESTEEIKDKYQEVMKMLMQTDFHSASDH